jgi:tetratricopeptide (TPR) repeat protein
MNKYVLWALIGFLLIMPTLVAQTHAPMPTPIPEEARRHFVMGETMFKEAKNVAAFTQAVAEFREAARIAPQWPDARYDLALAKEAAGDYSGAMDDLKLYQRFKLSDTEARTVQDKIYAIEAKQKLRVANAEADATAATAKRWEQQTEQANREAEAAQAAFPELMNKLRGAIFSIPDGHAYYFVTKPIHNPGFTVYGGASQPATDAYDATAHLKCEYSNTDSGSREFSAPGDVLPKSKYEVHVTGWSCGDFAISDDGRSLVPRESNGKWAAVVYRKQE